MIIEMNKKVEVDDLLMMEFYRPYFAKCISTNDDYAYLEYYVIERTHTDIFRIYNTNIEVFQIIELSLNELR